MQLLRRFYSPFWCATKEHSFGKAQPKLAWWLSPCSLSHSSNFLTVWVGRGGVCASENTLCCVHFFILLFLWTVPPPVLVFFLPALPRLGQGHWWWHWKPPPVCPRSSHWVVGEERCGRTRRCSFRILPKVTLRKCSDCLTWCNATHQTTALRCYCRTISQHLASVVYCSYLTDWPPW